ncbi:1-acyl-sn-glycerol-3-phosphate acyltransferase [Streptomyces sp. RS10V-4]|uniref:lysophospholipid acyltransferase family protein n=1 Tax=Streptomyces rhizoryzae TaxID=2932493 RepID=UPI0020064642|nr:lysophospholipid acyltransferase family protein [Streptomyces rhizoryzae]MCK7623526.1 1-acyl-sn-glycerol-3-phosphate acyltransferase [Streptomyces rhizoryzae]
MVGGAAAHRGAPAGPWDVRPLCTPRCAAHTAPRVPFPGTARRTAAFAEAVVRALADGPRLADPARLRAHARALLAALAIDLDLRTPDTEPQPGRGPGPGPLTVRGPGPGPLTVRGPAHGAPGAGPHRGRRPAPGTLIVANHISWLDIVALLAVEPTTLLAKREVGGWPVVGGLARRAGTHFIDRTSPRQLPHTVRELAGLLAAGRSVAVFPQATTWCTAARGAFRRATFQAALDAGAPVRPVTVDYTQLGRPTTVAAFCGADTFAASLRRVATARGLTVRVTVHPALPTAGRGPDRRTLAAAAERAVRGGRAAGRAGQAFGTYL